MYKKVAEMFYTVEDITNGYTYSDDADIHEYLDFVLTLPVAEAMESLSDFFNKSKRGNSIFAVNELIKNFPELTFGVYGSNTDLNDIRILSNKIVAINQNNTYHDNITVYDIGNALKYHGSRLYIDFCRLFVYDFSGKYLAKGESFIKLPKPYINTELTFEKYLFNNPDSEFIVKKSNYIY